MYSSHPLTIDIRRGGEENRVEIDLIREATCKARNDQRLMRLAVLVVVLRLMAGVVLVAVVLVLVVLADFTSGSGSIQTHTRHPLAWWCC